MDLNQIITQYSDRYGNRSDEEDLDQKVESDCFGGELDKQVVCRIFRHTTQHGMIVNKIQKGQLVRNSYKFK